jgi:hypothetical protein
MIGRSKMLDTVADRPRMVDGGWRDLVASRLRGRSAGATTVVGREWMERGKVQKEKKE